jgi:hypothetical protein
VIKAENHSALSIYVQNDCTNTTIRDNFIMRASANGISARSYGVTEGNIVWRNSIGILHGGSSQGAPVSIRNNVVFEGKDTGVPLGLVLAL